MNEEIMQTWLQEVVEGALVNETGDSPNAGVIIETFEEAGVPVYRPGLVFRFRDGSQFYVTISTGVPTEDPTAGGS